MTHTDLIARLRTGTTRIVQHQTSQSIEEVDDADEAMTAAADAMTASQERIEALEGALSRIDVGHGWAAQIARAALNDAGKGEG